MAFPLRADRPILIRRQEGLIDLDAKFEPNLLNTAIYLLGLSQQVSTFAINFQVCYLCFLPWVVVNISG